MGSMKVQDSSIVRNHAITTLSQDDEFSFRKSFPKLILWSLILLFVMGFIAGGFVLGAVHNAYLLIVVVILFGAVKLMINLISSPNDKLHFSFNSLLLQV
ncbi:PREDICTED: membrane [Prunus dulcis]|uniref:PREDICTED: membrane n=1 Tax=Prunus dulcis TaxID=3755 RepID=A0A5E4ES12_PRUDU|nr:hypothetical protein L3X38_014544 [Prunus dulcis]VVA18484.1 PREDICTED: membrane [Prunus dulcis]